MADVGSIAWRRLRSVRRADLAGLMASQRAAGKPVADPCRCFAVLMVLADRQGANACAWPSVASIAEDAGLSERTAQLVIGALRSSGVLEVVERSRTKGQESTARTNAYAVRFDVLDSIARGGAGAATAPERVQPLRPSGRSSCVERVQPLRRAGAAAAPPLLEEGTTHRTTQGTPHTGEGASGPPEAEEIASAFPPAAAGWDDTVAAAREAIADEASRPGGATAAEILAAVRASLPALRTVSWPPRWLRGRGYWPAVVAARSSATMVQAQSRRVLSEADQAMREDAAAAAAIAAVPPEEIGRLVELVVRTHEAVHGRWRGSRDPATNRHLRLEIATHLARRENAA